MGERRRRTQSRGGPSFHGLKGPSQVEEEEGEFNKHWGRYDWGSQEASLGEDHMPPWVSKSAGRRGLGTEP